MDVLELKDIILDGESTTVEFKRKFTTALKIAKEISALLNTKGGYIFFGIDDDGTVCGTDNEKGEIGLIEQACGFYLEPPVIPEIEIIDYFGKDIVVLSVDESNNKPHRVINSEKKGKNGIAYVRVGEQSVIASREMIKVLEGMISAKPLKMSVGKNERRLFQYLENHERVTVSDFARISNISKRRASQLIVRLVRAGILFIHQDSAQDYFTLNR